MAAETLNCPMCGASAASDATRCEHCGARLATVACPSCFGMIFQGAKFCSHCGARVDRTEVDAASPERCPRCQLVMNAVKVGVTELGECPRCEGLWANADSLEKICSEREQQAAVLGMAATITESQPVQLEQQVRYLPCPVCRKLMNRVNFAHCSGVVVDVCKTHGTWFDKDELRRIVEFIRGGGLEAARVREVEELEERRRALKAAQTAGAWDNRTNAEPPNLLMGPRYDVLETGISAAAAMLKTWLKA
jgi:Zn-finger nucleic acid-binding protein